MLALAQQSNILDFPTVAPQGKSNEWFTPSRYIEAAREVMGSIDLDPASCEMANRVVRAARYYTQAENGLLQDWRADHVWMNPPFGKVNNKSQMGLFISRLVEEYRHGNVKEAILLAISDTDATWFKWLWEYPICFVDHIVHYFKPTENESLFEDSRHSHLFGTIFVYLGPNEQRFIDIFSQFGTIAKRVSQPRHTISTPSLWEVAQ